MIRNERQYRVSLSESNRLADELQKEPSTDVPDWVLTATREALASQITDLDAELAEYVALRDGPVPAVTEVSNLSELPNALVRARIAAKLTQRELAERLNLREQQIQRYEANDYAGASIARIEEVMRALGVTFHGEVGLPVGVGDDSALRRTLTSLGIGRETINRRFLLGDRGPSHNIGWINAVTKAARIFDTDVEDLLEGNVRPMANTGLFRSSTVANRDQVNGYAHYAQYLAEKLMQACVVEYRPLPDADKLRATLGEDLTSEPLEALLRTCWSHGVPVLPLIDVGTFYGACWWITGRPVIALKNAVRTPERWAFLLAHEMDHARDTSGASVLEADLTVRQWRQQPGEIAADQFAVDVLLGDTVEAIVQVAVEEAKGNVALLKSVLPAVAHAGNVSLGILADHMAARMGANNINWWPTANSLHSQEADAWRVSRSILFEYVDFSRLDAIDRDILIDGISL